MILFAVVTVNIRGIVSQVFVWQLQIAQNDFI